MTQHDDIRICVLDPPTCRYFTWFRDNTVVIWQRGTSPPRTITGIDTLEELNWLLQDCGAQPVGFGRRGKRIEREVEQYAIPF